MGESWIPNETKSLHTIVDTGIAENLTKFQNKWISFEPRRAKNISNLTRQQSVSF
jgi:hypothetical protein